MKRFLVFDRVHTAVERVDDLVLYDTSDRVTYTLRHKYGSLFGGVTSLGKNRFFAAGRAIARYNGFEGKLNTDMNKQTFVSVSGEVSKGLLLAAFHSTAREMPRDHSVTRYMSGCQSAVYGRYTGPEWVSHLGVGVKGDQTTCSLSLCSESLNVVVSGVLNDRGNLLKLAFLTGFHVFGAMKADVSMRQLVRFHIGALLDAEKGTLFSVLDSRGKLGFGGFAHVGENLSLGFKGNADVNGKQVEAQVGAILKQKAKLAAKFELSSRNVELVASFSPRKWVDVSLKSVASLSHRPVVYGWAIDFHNDC